MFPAALVTGGRLQRWSEWALVYVDDTAIRKHGREWFHLIADDMHELHAFATALGLPERAFHRGARHPHYDIPAEQRQRALDRGAQPITTRDAVRISRRLRSA